jgi:hypothetical protein
MSLRIIPGMALSSPGKRGMKIFPFTEMDETSYPSLQSGLIFLPHSRGRYPRDPPP